MTKQDPFDPHAPPCPDCEEQPYMVLEEATWTERRWHCRRCGTKTSRKTRLGRVLSLVSLIDLAATLVGIVSRRHGSSSPHTVEQRHTREDL